MKRTPCFIIPPGPGKFDVISEHFQNIKFLFDLVNNAVGHIKIKIVNLKMPNDNVKLRGNHVALRNVELRGNHVALRNVKLRATTLLYAM